MSATAARGAAGYLYASGRMRMHNKNQRKAERAAEGLKREREAKDKRNHERKP
jgi:hypothetical protein